MATDAEMPCDGALEPVLKNGHAVCPWCHHTVPIKLIADLWTFLPHDNKGRLIEVLWRGQEDAGSD